MKSSATENKIYGMTFLRFQYWDYLRVTLFSFCFSLVSCSRGVSWPREESFLMNLWTTRKKSTSEKKKTVVPIMAENANRSHCGQRQQPRATIINQNAFIPAMKINWYNVLRTLSFKRKWTQNTSIVVVPFGTYDQSPLSGETKIAVVVAIKCAIITI